MAWDLSLPLPPGREALLDPSLLLSGKCSSYLLSPVLRNLNPSSFLLAPNTQPPGQSYSSDFLADAQSISCPLMKTRDFRRLSLTLSPKHADLRQLDFFLHAPNPGSQSSSQNNLHVFSALDPTFVQTPCDPSALPPAPQSVPAEGGKLQIPVKCLAAPELQDLRKLGST